MALKKTGAIFNQSTNPDSGIDSNTSSQLAAPVMNDGGATSCAHSELYDSSCTCHISPYRDDFENFEAISPKSFCTANQEMFSATGTGSITVDVPAGVDIKKLELTEVMYCPEVGYTLISIGKLDDHGFMATFADGKCTIHLPSGELVGEVPKNQRGAYRVDQEKVEGGDAAALEMVMLDQLHRHMGHISPRVTCHMVTKGFAMGV